METKTATTIRLCGPLVVEMEGRRLEAALPSRQGRLAFAYLVLNRGRAVSRRELVEALWPGGEPTAAQKLVTELLSRLRRALPTGVLQGRSQLSLHLDPDAWIDVEVAADAVTEARDALGAADASAAMSIASRGLELLASPLLGEIDRPWLDESRRALEDVRADLLELVARAGLRLAGEELAAAGAAARELIEREPFRESAYALLMEVHAARGDGAQALRVYDELRTLLRDELGTVPAPSVRAFAERLLTNPAEGSLRGLPSALHRDRVFVGRADEFAQLLDAWRAGAGHRRLVLLTGEPGIGKTSLAAQAATRLEADGAVVLYGRSDPEPLAPFQPFAEAIGELAERAPAVVGGGVNGHAAVLARILPRLRAGPDPNGGGDAQAERHRLFDAVTQTIAAAAGRRRALFVLDDAHWADRPTLLLLRYVLRHGPPGLTVLGTVRPFEESRGPLSELVVELRRDGHLERLRVGGLDAGSTGELVAARTAVAPHPAFVRWLQARTGGNPFFMEQVLGERGDVDVASAPTPEVLEWATAPEGVRDLVAQRLSRLGADAAEALRIAATLGQELRLVDVERVVGDRAAALAALDEAVASGLLRETGDVAGGFAFVHALAREAIHGSMTATRRAALHLRVGEALESEAAPAVLAHHFHEARHLVGPEKAVRYSIAAAEASLQALAYEAEIQHYTTALRVLDEAGSTDDETRCRILLNIADREVSLGGDVRDRVEHAAEIAQRHGWADVLSRAAVLHARIAEYGSVDHVSVHLLERALAALGDDESPARARALSRLAEALYHDPAARGHRDALTRQALEMARRTEDDEVLMGVIHSRIRAISGPDSIDEQLGLAAEGLELVQRLDDRAWAFGLHMVRINLLRRRHDFAAARAELVALDALVDQLRLRGTYNDAERAMLQATQCALAGHLTASERLAHEAHDIFARLVDPDAEYLLVAQLLPIRIAQARGDELVPRIAAWAARPGRELPWQALLALLHLHAGRRPEARRELLALAADDFGAIPIDEDWLGTLVVLAEVCSVVGEPAHARALERRLRPYADQFALLIYSVLPLGPVSHALARLARSLGHIDEAIVCLEQTLASAGAMDAPLIAANATVELAHALRTRAGPGDPQRARQLVNDTGRTAPDRKP